MDCNPLRITTFNLENLFNRYQFLDQPGASYELQRVPAGITSMDRGGRPECEATTVAQRNHTARAILDSKPDILAVQEVEDLWALRSFNDEYLDRYFGQMIMLEGNDGRGIDVGLCLRYGLEAKDGFNAKVRGIRTHADDVDPNSKNPRINRYFDASAKQLVVTNALFSRDCLEVDLDVAGLPLTFLVNHFKAPESDSSKATTANRLRKRQSQRVAELVKEAQTNQRLPIVLGDLNEDWRVKPSGPDVPSLAPLHVLVQESLLADALESLSDDWTYYYTIEKETSRFDSILVAKELAPAVCDASILRKGISLKCDKGDPRYPSIGYVGTEASSHCPVTITLDLSKIPGLVRK